MLHFQVLLSSNSLQRAVSCLTLWVTSRRQHRWWCSSSSSRWWPWWRSNSNTKPTWWCNNKWWAAKEDKTLSTRCLVARTHSWRTQWCSSSRSTIPTLPSIASKCPSPANHSHPNPKIHLLTSETRTICTKKHLAVNKSRTCLFRRMLFFFSCLWIAQFFPL